MATESSGLKLSAAALPVPPQAITASLMLDDGGKEPVYCLMVAYRSESDARTALSLLAPAPAAPQLPLAESALSHDECMRWLAVINPVLKYAGSPGDWGYESRLGRLTQHLYQLRAELERALRRDL